MLNKSLPVAHKHCRASHIAGAAEAR